MKKIVECIRLIFISFEFLYVVVIAAIAIHYPAVLSELGASIRANAEVLKWIPILPLTICAFVFQLAWRITTPLPGSNRLLYDWPNYWRLVCRRNASIVLSVVAAAAAVYLWMFSGRLNDTHIGSIFALALGVALIDMSCIAFAGFKVKEMIDQ
jgi:hypothetical protein